MDKTFQYVGNCISARENDIRDMVDESLTITRKTFLQHVDYETVMKDIEEQLGYVTSGPGLHMAGDWAVSYYRSFYRGERCYYFDWSSIEYIFQELK